MLALLRLLINASKSLGLSASKAISFFVLGCINPKLLACKACLPKLLFFCYKRGSIFLNFFLDLPYDLSPIIEFPLKFICTLI